MDDQALVEHLTRLTEGKSKGFRYRRSFWRNSGRIWVRARFHCEYCGIPMLGNVMAFYSYEFDHILPASKYPGNPLVSMPTSALLVSKDLSLDDISNLALSCKLCNRLKSDFDPNDKIGVYSGDGPLDPETRRALIKSAWEEIHSRRGEHDEMFRMVTEFFEANRREWLPDAGR